MELQSVTVFYQGRYHAVANLAPGATFHVQTLFTGNKIGLPASQWVGNLQTLAPAGVGQGEAFNNQEGYHLAKQPYELLKNLMFHAKADNGQMSNSGLGMFDQSWRLEAEKTATGGQTDQVCATRSFWWRGRRRYTALLKPSRATPVPPRPSGWAGCPAAEPNGRRCRAS